MKPVAMIGHAWRTPVIAGRFARIAGEPKGSRQGRFLRRMGMFGLEVAVEALGASGIAGGARVGLFSGVGGLRAHWGDMMGAFANQEDDGARMWERGFKDVHPYWMLRHLSNNVHALASAELDLRGEGATFGGGNGGAQAIAAAARALADGAIDAAVVVAYDSLLEPETLVEIDVKYSADFVAGEAAAALVLVRERDGAPMIAVRDAAGENALAHCVEALGSGVEHAQQWSVTDTMGNIGAATAAVQAIAFAERLRTSPLRVALGLATAAPDLASAIRVEVSR